MWGEGRSQGCCQSLLWGMEILFTEMPKTVGGAILGGKWSRLLLFMYPLKCLSDIQKLLGIQVWTSGRGWNCSYKLGELSDYRRYLQPKERTSAADNHRVAGIRLIPVLIVIISSGGMGEWPKTDRFWRRFNSWEKGASLDEIHVFTGPHPTPMPWGVLTSPCNTQGELQQQEAAWLGWGF